MLSNVIHIIRDNRRAFLLLSIIILFLLIVYAAFQFSRTSSPLSPLLMQTRLSNLRSSTSELAARSTHYLDIASPDQLTFSTYNNQIVVSHTNFIKNNLYNVDGGFGYFVDNIYLCSDFKFVCTTLIPAYSIQYNISDPTYMYLYKEWPGIHRFVIPPNDNSVTELKRNYPGCAILGGYVEARHFTYLLQTQNNTILFNGQKDESGLIIRSSLQKRRIDMSMLTYDARHYYDSLSDVRNVNSNMRCKILYDNDYILMYNFPSDALLYIKNNIFRYINLEKLINSLYNDKLNPLYVVELGIAYDRGRLLLVTTSSKYKNIKYIIYVLKTDFATNEFVLLNTSSVPSLNSNEITCGVSNDKLVLLSQPLGGVEHQQYVAVDIP
jgi:hypothetical protein